MKLLVLIIHANLKQDVADFLRGIEKVNGFTFSAVEGHGVQSEEDPFLSNQDKVVGYTPRTRVDILLEDIDVASTLASLRENGIGLKNGTVYWISKVEETGRL